MTDGRQFVSQFAKDSLLGRDKIADNFPVYASRQSIARFMALSRLFEMQLPVKGSIVECGVFQGMGLFTYSHLSQILEPVNYHRQIIGFDTFEGFPNFTEFDTRGVDEIGKFHPDYDTFTELTNAYFAMKKNQLLSDKDKIRLIRGDAKETIPQFIKDNPYFICSMLYLDFDIYEPTVVAIRNFLPRMPKGAILAFDEIHNPNWAGETLALLETIGINRLSIKCFPFDPHVSYAVIE